MKCLVCRTNVPANQIECPGCGEHLGQWLEMNTVGRQFFDDGLRFARAGRGLKAALSLAKASVFLPTDPEVIAALGKVLAQHGEYDDAAFFLAKAISAAEREGVEVSSDLQAALAKAEELAAQDEVVSPLLALVPFMRACPPSASDAGPATAGEEESDREASARPQADPAGAVANGEDDADQAAEDGRPAEPVDSSESRDERTDGERSPVESIPDAAQSQPVDPSAEPHDQETAEATSAAAPQPQRTPLEQAWQFVTDLEQRGDDLIRAIAPIFSWPVQLQDGMGGPWLYLQALSALVEGDEAAACELFRSSLEADGSHINSKIYLAHLGFQAGDVEPVLQLFEQIDRDADETARTVLISSRVLGSREGTERQLEFLESCQTANPQLAGRFRDDLAKLYYSLEWYDEALPLLKQIVCEEPSAVDWQKSLLRTFIQLGRGADGCAFYEALDQDKPGYWQTKSSLARLYWKAQDHQRAISALKDGLTLDALSDEGAYELHRMLAEASERTGDVDQTRTHINAALGICPDDSALKQWLNKLEIASGTSGAVTAPAPE